MRSTAIKSISLIRLITVVQLFAALLVSQSTLAGSADCIRYFGKNPASDENSSRVRKALEWLGIVKKVENIPEWKPAAQFESNELLKTILSPAVKDSKNWSQIPKKDEVYAWLESRALGLQSKLPLVSHRDPERVTLLHSLAELKVDVTKIIEPMADYNRSGTISEILRRFRQDSLNTEKNRLEEISLKTIGRAPSIATLSSLDVMSKYTGRSLVTLLKYFEFTKKQLPDLAESEILILMQMSHYQKRTMVDVVSVVFEIQQIFKKKWLYRFSIRKLEIIEQLAMAEAALKQKLNGSEIVEKFFEIQKVEKAMGTSRLNETARILLLRQLNESGESDLDSLLKSLTEMREKIGSQVVGGIPLTDSSLVLIHRLKSRSLRTIEETVNDLNQAYQAHRSNRVNQQPSVELLLQLLEIAYRFKLSPKEVVEFKLLADDYVGEKLSLAKSADLLKNILDSGDVDIRNLSEQLVGDFFKPVPSITDVADYLLDPETKKYQIKYAEQVQKRIAAIDVASERRDEKFRTRPIEFRRRVGRQSVNRNQSYSSQNANYADQDYFLYYSWHGGFFQGYRVNRGYSIDLSDGGLFDSSNSFSDNPYDDAAESENQ